jgi:hypothetical protein
VIASAVDPAAVSPEVARFVEYSVDPTGFTRFDLYASDMAKLYYHTVIQQLGLSTGDALFGGPDAGASRLEISEATRLEVERAVTYLWYSGAWPRIAPEAHAELRRQKPIPSLWSRPRPTPKAWSGGPSVDTQRVPNRPASAPGLIGRRACLTSTR